MPNLERRNPSEFLQSDENRNILERLGYEIARKILNLVLIFI
ncbi:hypothetical protein PRUB_a2533 [Pseudoalteromonas rubra]|uniref:Uncharacterized protein n=1 Tax=Pseudoalteromonas rubra TaxID=43658 RepID=A0A8T0CBC9_9GAMM|nr:hypothetical protein PRUB_a2533 [Pseudoalteromonas rubra]